MVPSPRLKQAALCALVIALGALLALGLAPSHHLWAVPFALGVLGFLVLGLPNARRGALTGWLFGTGYFFVAMNWIIEPFQIDAERYAWMAPFALVLLAAGLALFWMVAFWATMRMGLAGGARIAALVCFWSLAELARAYVLTGLPWAAFGQFWMETRLSGTLAWMGPQGLAVMSLAAFVPLGLVAVNRARLRDRCLAGLPTLVFLGLLLLLPHPHAIGTAQADAPVVRLIQPNAPQDQKWHPDHYLTFFYRQLDFTAAPGQRHDRPDMIVWPETAVPGLLENAGGYFARIAEAAQGVPVVLGIQRREEARYFNSLVYLDETGAVAGRYDKHHLVPFGEYVPFGDLMAQFGIYGFAAREGAGFSPGPGPELLDLGRLGSALPLICYEAVFPQDVNAAPERPDFLMQITNDAWFGPDAGPYQHLVQARMRAIEQGLPMVRVANTGVSAMIDPYGRITSEIPLGQAGFVDALLPNALPATLYSRSGDWPVLGLLLLALAWLRFGHSRVSEHRNLANRD